MPKSTIITIATSITLILASMSVSAGQQGKDSLCSDPQLPEQASVEKKFRGDQFTLSMLREAQLQTCDKNAETTKQHLLNELENNSLTHKKLPAH